MKGKRLVQLLVVVALLTSVLSTAALADDRLSPEDNNGRDADETYGEQSGSVDGDYWTDGPGNITTADRYGLEVGRYIQFWSFDKDTIEVYSQPSLTGNATYDWLNNDVYPDSPEEANRTFRYLPFVNDTDFSYSEPPADAVNTYNQNDFRNAPNGKFEPERTSYAPTGITQNDPNGIAGGFENKAENHLDDGTGESAGTGNEGACRTFPDREDPQIDNGSHEGVSFAQMDDAEDNDTHCWIEAAYVDEHSVSGLVVMQEVYAGDGDPNTTPDFQHPINDSRKAQQDNSDGIRRFIPDSGKARAIVDFRANTSDTTNLGDIAKYYPDEYGDAEFNNTSQNIYKEWWKNPENPHVNWTRIVNRSSCPVPADTPNRAPDCEYGIEAGDKHTPVIEYSTNPAEVQGNDGDWKVGPERKFYYQTKFSVTVEHYERQCMRITDPDDDDGDNDPDGRIASDLPDDAIVFVDGGTMKVQNFPSFGETDNGYDGHDDDVGDRDNSDDYCDQTNAVDNPSTDGNAPNNENSGETETQRTADNNCNYDDSDDDGYEDENGDGGNDQCDTDDRIYPGSGEDDDCDYNNDQSGADGNDGDTCDGNASLDGGDTSPDGDCDFDDDDGDGAGDRTDSNDNNENVTLTRPMGATVSAEEVGLSDSEDSSETVPAMLTGAVDAVVETMVSAVMGAVKTTIATGAEAHSWGSGSSQYEHTFDGEDNWGQYQCQNDPKSADNSDGVDGSFDDYPSDEDVGLDWENAVVHGGGGNEGDDSFETGDGLPTSDEPHGDKVMAVVQTMELVSMDYIASDETYVHVQTLDEGAGAGPAYAEAGVPEFDAAYYEDGDRAVHFSTGDEPWRRLGLHGTQYGLSAGWSFYAGRNLGYDYFTRYAYPTQYSTDYAENITGHHRRNPDDGLGVVRGVINKNVTNEDYDDDLVQNSSLTPVQMHGYPTEAGIQVGPDLQEELVGSIEVTHDVGLDSGFTHPPTILGVTKDERRHLYVSRELPEGAGNFSRGTEVAFRYNKSAVREASGYSYASQFYPSPTYDNHNLTFYGIVPRENQTKNITKALMKQSGDSDHINRSSATINKTNLDMTVVNTNQSANTVTVEFNLTSSNGPINQKAYDGYTDTTGGISCGVTQAEGDAISDANDGDDQIENLGRPLGVIKVVDADDDRDKLSDVRTKYDNGTVRHTYNSSKIEGRLRAEYEPIQWWDTPRCYPMHEPSSDEITFSSGPVFTGAIARLIGLVMVLSILSYAYNTVVVAAGGDRREETFIGWLWDEIYEAITGWF